MELKDGQCKEINFLKYKSVDINVSSYSSNVYFFADDAYRSKSFHTIHDTLPGPLHHSIKGPQYRFQFVILSLEKLVKGKLV